MRDILGEAFGGLHFYKKVLPGTKGFLYLDLETLSAGEVGIGAAAGFTGPFAGKAGTKGLTRGMFSPIYAAGQFVGFGAGGSLTSRTFLNQYVFPGRLPAHETEPFFKKHRIIHASEFMEMARRTLGSSRFSQGTTQAERDVILQELDKLTQAGYYSKELHKYIHETRVGQSSLAGVLSRTRPIQAGGLRFGITTEERASRLLGALQRRGISATGYGISNFDIHFLEGAARHSLATPHDVLNMFRSIMPLGEMPTGYLEEVSAKNLGPHQLESVSRHFARGIVEDRPWARFVPTAIKQGFYKAFQGVKFGELRHHLATVDVEMTARLHSALGFAGSDPYYSGILISQMTNAGLIPGTPQHFIRERLAGAYESGSYITGMSDAATQAKFFGQVENIYGARYAGQLRDVFGVASRQTSGAAALSQVRGGIFLGSHGTPQSFRAIPAQVFEEGARSGIVVHGEVITGARKLAFQVGGKRKVLPAAQYYLNILKQNLLSTPALSGRTAGQLLPQIIRQTRAQRLRPQMGTMPGLTLGESLTTRSPGTLRATSLFGELAASSYEAFSVLPPEMLSINAAREVAGKNAGPFIEELARGGQSELAAFYQFARARSQYFKAGKSADFKGLIEEEKQLIRQLQGIVGPIGASKAEAIERGVVALEGAQGIFGAATQAERFQKKGGYHALTRIQALSESQLAQLSSTPGLTAGKPWLAGIGEAIEDVAKSSILKLRMAEQLAGTTATHLFAPILVGESLRAGLTADTAFVGSGGVLTSERLGNLARTRRVVTKVGRRGLKLRIGSAADYQEFAKFMLPEGLHETFYGALAREKGAFSAGASLAERGLGLSALPTFTGHQLAAFFKARGQKFSGLHRLGRQRFRLLGAVGNVWGQSSIGFSLEQVAATHLPNASYIAGQGRVTSVGMMEEALGVERLSLPAMFMEAGTFKTTDPGLAAAYHQLALVERLGGSHTAMVQLARQMRETGDLSLAHKYLSQRFGTKPLDAFANLFSYQETGFELAPRTGLTVGNILKGIPARAIKVRSGTGAVYGASMMTKLGYKSGALLLGQPIALRGDVMADLGYGNVRVKADQIRMLEMYARHAYPENPMLDPIYGPVARHLEKRGISFAGGQLRVSGGPLRDLLYPFRSGTLPPELQARVAKAVEGGIQVGGKTFGIPMSSLLPGGLSAEQRVGTVLGQEFMGSVKFLELPGPIDVAVKPSGEAGAKTVSLMHFPLLSNEILRTGAGPIQAGRRDIITQQVKLIEAVAQKDIKGVQNIAQGLVDTFGPSFTGKGNIIAETLLSVPFAASARARYLKMSNIQIQRARRTFAEDVTRKNLQPIIDDWTRIAPSSTVEELIKRLPRGERQIYRDYLKKKGYIPVWERADPMQGVSHSLLTRVYTMSDSSAGELPGIYAPEAAAIVHSRDFDKDPINLVLSRVEGAIQESDITRRIEQQRKDFGLILDRAKQLGGEGGTVDEMVMNALKKRTSATTDALYELMSMKLFASAGYISSRYFQIWSEVLASKDKTMIQERLRTWGFSKDKVEAGLQISEEIMEKTAFGKGVDMMVMSNIAVKNIIYGTQKKASEAKGAIFEVLTNLGELKNQVAKGRVTNVRDAIDYARTVIEKDYPRDVLSREGLEITMLGGLEKAGDLLVKEKGEVNILRTLQNVLAEFYGTKFYAEGKLGTLPTIGTEIHAGVPKTFGDLLMETQIIGAPELRLTSVPTGPGSGGAGTLLEAFKEGGGETVFSKFRMWAEKAKSFAKTPAGAITMGGMGVVAGYVLLDSVFGKREQDRPEAPPPPVAGRPRQPLLDNPFEEAPMVRPMMRRNAYVAPVDSPVPSLSIHYTDPRNDRMVLDGLQAAAVPYGTDNAYIHVTQRDDRTRFNPYSVRQAMSDMERSRYTV